MISITRICMLNVEVLNRGLAKYLEPYHQLPKGMLLLKSMAGQSHTGFHHHQVVRVSSSPGIIAPVELLQIVVGR